MVAHMQSGMSQSEFARATEVSVGTLQEWEQGRKVPSTMAWGRSVCPKHRGWGAVQQSHRINGISHSRRHLDCLCGDGSFQLLAYFGKTT